MKVVLFAWCPTATYYLEALIAAGVPPARVVTGPSGTALASSCERNGVPVQRIGDANAPELLQELQRLEPDLLLVSGWPRILRPPLRQLARLGSLNFHPSLLPDYRGRHPLYWAIARGEKRVGISVHHLTDEVDAGPILFQAAVDVPQDATSSSLAHAVDSVGAGWIPELLELARRGALPLGVRPSSPGSYFEPVRSEHAGVDWSRAGVELERWLRACQGTIQPYTFHAGMKLVPLAAKLAGQLSAGPPGTILRIDPDGITVATKPGTPALSVGHFWFLEREHDALGITRLLRLAVGDGFGAQPAASSRARDSATLGRPPASTSLRRKR